MSHFTVMVIGDNVDEQLQPFHEYECTGTDDEYVIDVDITDEVNAWLEKSIWVGISKSSGEPDYFFNEAGAIEHLDDWSEMMRGDWFNSAGKDVNVEVDEWFGCGEPRDGKYYNHTNPNAKWDWYQVGGRWSGFFKVKDAALAEQGERSWTNRGEATTPNYADITTKGNIDIMGMMNDIRKERNADFDHLEAAIGDIEPVSWTALREEFEAAGKDIQDARDTYANTEFQKTIVAYENANDVQIGGFFSNIYDDYYLHLPLNQARVRYVETAALNVVTPYAFVKDSQWVQRGDMGWWGMSSGDMDKDEWAQKFYDMFNELPDDTLITMVDCHI